jgi:hypothetical protein
VSNSNAVLALIQGLQNKDPRLYDALILLIKDVEAANNVLFPPIILAPGQTTAPQTVPDVTNFQYELRLDNVRLFWTSPADTILRYVIKQGSDWATANTIATTDTLQIVIDPILVGTTRFLIKAVGEDGTESVNATPLDVIVPPLGIITITSRVIDNNVLLIWTAPTSSFRIATYEVREGSDLLGSINGTFIAIFESVSGTYTYKIKAIDIAGNESAEAIIDVTVSQPPDYELQADFLSDLNGTPIRVLRYSTGPRLLCCVRNETWAQHFSDRGWTNIQDQLNAGYPLYIHPSEADGSYTEIIDYGLVISNTVATPTYNTEVVYPSGVNVQLSLSYSLDNITYSSPVVVTTSLFIASLRYLKVEVAFTAID